MTCDMSGRRPSGPRTDVLPREVTGLAGSFSQDFIESVRNAGDIVRLVSDYVPLKPAGSRLKGLCPFHEEKTPAFSIDPGRQLFYCFVIQSCRRDRSTARRTRAARPYDS